MGTPDARPRTAEMAGYRDPVIDAYKAGIDRTLLRENLKLTAEQRLEELRRCRRSRRSCAEPGAWSVRDDRL